TDPSAANAMLVNGNINIQSSCGILVDSSSSTGLVANGNIVINAQTIGVVGNYLSTGNVSLTPTPRTGMIAAADPLAYVSAPTVGGCDHTSFSLNGNNGTSSSYYQMYPGVYCGGILLNGNTYANFNPGTYVIAGGGMLVNGNAWLKGTGITFYNT